MNILLHQGGKKEDILTCAQAEYGDKQGIVYVCGENRTLQYACRYFWESKGFGNAVDDPVELWGTSDGLYAREVLTPRLKHNLPGAERWEFLDTPDGSCLLHPLLNWALEYPYPMYRFDSGLVGRR